MFTNTQTIPVQEKKAVADQPSPNRFFDVGESASGLAASCANQLREPLQAHGLQAQSTGGTLGTTSSLHHPLLTSPLCLLGHLRFLLGSMGRGRMTSQMRCHLERSITF